MKNIFFIFLFIFFINIYGYSAIKYLYNGNTELNNVYFPMFDDNGIYSGDTVIPYIKVGANSVNSGSPDTPYATFDYAVSQLQENDELWIIKSDTVYVSNVKYSKETIAHKLKSNMATISVLYNSSPWFRGEKKIDIYGLILDFNRLTGQEYKFYYSKITVSFNPHFCYNQYKGDYAGYAGIYYSMSETGDTSYVKNNYFYDLYFTSSNAKFSFYYNVVFSNNVIDSVSTNNNSKGLFNGTTYNDYIFNNYITNCKNMNNFFNSGYNATRHYNNAINNSSFTNINGGYLSGPDLIVINGDTYFFNRSDTAGFDRTGLEFFLKYGNFSPDTIANVLGLSKLTSSIDTQAGIISSNVFSIDTKILILTYDTNIFNYDTQYLILRTNYFNSNDVNNMLYNADYKDSSYLIARLLYYDTPVLINFNNDDTIVPNIKFKWYNIKGANATKFEIANDVNFNNKIVDIELPINTDEYDYTFYNNGTYYWRIKGLYKK